MMDNDSQLKLQAYLDHELPEAQAREVAIWLDRDPEAAALAAELRNTTQALTGFEAAVKLPESREFFWSKIERQIQVQEQPREVPQGLPLLALLRRFMVPAGAFAALAIAAFMVLVHGSAAPSLESDSKDPGVFTYRDFAHGTTLVWLSYPADNEVAQDAAAGTLPP